MCLLPIHTNHTQVEYAGSAAQHVKTNPRVADDLAKDPSALDLVDHCEWHDED